MSTFTEISSEQTVILLGPQGRTPTLTAALEELGVGGRIATVTAGWQERETETRRPADRLSDRFDNLELHRRGDDVFAKVPEIASLHNERQRRLQALQSLYNVRLVHTARAVIELTEHAGPADLVAESLHRSLDAVRRLDREHLDQVRGIHEEYRERLRLDRHSVGRRHQRELAEIVGRAEAIAIAGGHVAVLLNRLRLFGITEMIREKPVIGWSAGAMVLGERIVVYHDRPPQGPGNAEVLEVGLGLCRGVIALPHARTRLRLDDAARVSRFARRWAPDRCLALDDGARLVVSPDHWSVSPGTSVLGTDGRVEELAA